MPFEPGQQAGDYEILEKLGQGGMGVVYKARNTLSDRIEVLKVLLPNLTETAELTDRFLREIRVTASLTHPNIAAFYTAQRIEGQVVMVLEYVPGETLTQILRKGRLPLSQALDLAGQALAALGFAHENGVVHRDIKPANMMLTPNGVLKLMDFGIAKAASSADLTRTGTTMGSLHYMSPEQVRGAGELDHRSDLYSFGVTLYEMCTGARPFQGSSDWDIMSAHLEKEPPPPVSVDPSLPQVLNDLILMSVAKDPEQRFQTAQAFRAALSGAASQIGKAAAAEQQAPTAVAGAPAQAQPTATAAGASAPSPPQPPQAGGSWAGSGGAGHAQAPQASAAAPPQKSRRGLYMAAGAVLALGVAAGAMIWFAEWRPTGAAETFASWTGGETAVEEEAQALAGSPSFGDERRQGGEQEGALAQGAEEAAFEGSETVAEAAAPEQAQAETGGPGPGAQTAAVAASTEGAGGDAQASPSSQPREEQLAAASASSSPASSSGGRTAPAGTSTPGSSSSGGTREASGGSSAPSAAAGGGATPSAASSSTQTLAQAASPAQPPAPPGGTQAAAAQVQSAQGGAGGQAATVDEQALREVEDLFAKAAIRANVVRQQLADLEEEQRRQGLSLRGDMDGARRRMEFLLDQTQADLEADDAGSARKNLRLAERQLSKLESFLGM